MHWRARPSAASSSLARRERIVWPESLARMRPDPICVVGRCRACDLPPAQTLRGRDRCGMTLLYDDYGMKSAPAARFARMETDRGLPADRDWPRRGIENGVVEG